MMDIQAAPSSTPRPQDPAGPGKTPGGKGFAGLLDSLAGKPAADPAPPARREEEPEAAAAATDADAGTRPAEARGEPRQGEERPAEPAERAASTEKTPAEPDSEQRPGAAQSAALAQATGEAATRGPGSGPAAAQPAVPQGGPALGATGQPAPDAALAAAQQTAAPAQAAAGAFRVAGQEAPLRGEVRLEAAGQAPRTALSGSTALAASLAASTEGGGQASADARASAQGLVGATSQGSGAIADGTAAKTFAGLAAGAAGQGPGAEAAPGGQTQVLQAPGGGEILLHGGADSARVQVTPPSQPNPAPSGAAASAPAPLPDQVAVQMHRAVSLGKDRLSIQLHPAELGRVDVKLELGQDGSVRAVLQADRKDTLELLQRDVRGLERALQNAGLQTDGDSISFDLRGGQQQRSGQGFAAHQPQSGPGQDSGTADTAEPAPQPRGGEARHDGAVNIRV